MKRQLTAATAATLAMFWASIGSAGTPTSPDDIQFDVQPLTVTVSRIERDSFGNPVHPFTAFTAGEADPGTVVLAKVTPLGPATWEVQPDRCWVASFRDDLGTDLSTNAARASEDHFFPRNRPLDVLTARDNSRFLGLRVRSQRLPAPGASRLIADVVLLCRLNGEEKTKELRGVRIQTKEVVTVGPLQVKFLPSNLGQSLLARTNNAVAKPIRYCLAAFLPQSDVAIASVTFFSAQSDEPILAARNITADGVAGSSHPAVTEKKSNSEADADPFANCTGYGFAPPENGQVTIKVRYYDARALVEKHCIISTGLSP